MQVIKNLGGLSGADVLLVKDRTVFVRKTGEIERNYERLQVLSPIVNVPKIFNKTDTTLDMEYIQGLDIVQYLKYHDTGNLVDFIVETIHKFAQGSQLKDYTDIYYKKLSTLDFAPFPFTKEQLVDSLPKQLPASVYHGDFTFDNFLYGANERFYLIDPITSEYDSWIFDLAKLRQDTESKWFIRDQTVYLDVELQTIEQQVFSRLGVEPNNSILILMLLRVWPYVPHEQPRLLQEIQRLWK